MTSRRPRPISRRGELEFNGSIEEMNFGRTLMLKVPGADDLMLYEPRHQQAHSL